MHRHFTIGLPAKETDPIYGLYSFALDRFIIVEMDLKIAQKTVALMYPKIDLRIVELNSADNFFPQIIDNSVVENWSYITNDYFVNLRENLNFVITPTSLVEHKLLDIDKTRVEKIKKWTLMCRFWVAALEDARTNRLHENLSQEFYQTFINENNFPRVYYEVEKSILQEIFIGLDLEQVDTTCRELAKQSQHFDYALTHNFNYPAEN